MSWNHNTHHHPIILRAIPSPCLRALDLGCGEGGFARKLAKHCREVVAIDIDQGSLNRAKKAGDSSNITFVHGDFLTQPLEEASFDFVVAIATLHHIPLRAGLLGIRNLLAPGGVLVLVGLYRAVTLTDHALATVAMPISRLFGLLRSEDEVGAPMLDPVETLAEIRNECDSILAGGVFRRRLFFRYTFEWRKPLMGAHAGLGTL